MQPLSCYSAPSERDHTHTHTHAHTHAHSKSHVTYVLASGLPLAAIGATEHIAIFQARFSIPVIQSTMVGRLDAAALVQQ
jgi:hypothetical protein